MQLKLVFIEYSNIYTRIFYENVSYSAQFVMSKCLQKRMNN